LRVLSCGHDATHLKSLCEGRVSLASLSGGNFIEGEKHLASKHSPSLHVELAQVFETQHFIKFSVRNGSQIHLWFDDWYPNGVLNAKYGPRVIYYAQSKLDAPLSTVIKDGQWM
jgi:hypothetical protein